MGSTKLSKCSVCFGLSLAAASILNGLLVVAKEKNPGVMAGMARLTGHHWITQVTVVVLVFVGGGFVLTRANGGQGLKPTARSLLLTLVSGVVLGALIITGFYLLAG